MFTINPVFLTFKMVIQLVRTININVKGDRKSYYLTVFAVSKKSVKVEPYKTCRL